MNSASPPGVQPTLDYATPQPAPLEQKHYRAALFCGTCPLVVGALVFLLWLPTRASLFVWLGLLTIMSGVVMFGIGGICLIAFFVQLSRQPLEIRRGWWGRFSLAGLLLVANFPVCYAIIRAVMHIEHWGDF